MASRLQGGEGARRLEESGEEEVKAIICGLCILSKIASSRQRK